MNLVGVLKGKGGCRISQGRKGWWSFIFGGGAAAIEQIAEDEGST